MSLGIDPIVSNILFTLNLIPHCCGITTMLRERSDVVQARVLRDGPSLLSRFLLLDTATWH